MRPLPVFEGVWSAFALSLFGGSQNLERVEAAKKLGRSGLFSIGGCPKPLEVGSTTTAEMKGDLMLSASLPAIHLLLMDAIPARMGFLGNMGGRFGREASVLLCLRHGAGRCDSFAPE
ncbi:MAG: hypothetical protein V4640_03045 [Verrucomicrobiota bacterium]